MITAEWAYAVFSEAQHHGLATAVVSDGNTTPEALAFLRPVTDVFRLDIKATEAAPHGLVGTRRFIGGSARGGYWVEAVTMYPA